MPKILKTASIQASRPMNMVGSKFSFVGKITIKREPVAMILTAKFYDFRREGF